MSTTVEPSNEFDVIAVPTPLEQESKDGIFVFAYTITISNHSDETAQLLERHWIIESAGEQIGEVTGDGVVGVQPTLKPGESFEYTSSVVIRDPIGAMEGSYVFRNASGRAFIVQIPRFTLVFPALYH